MFLLFFIGLIILIVGYMTYSKYITKLLQIDSNQVTPANKINDGVDFVPLNKRKNQLIQLLNIAGTGPIYGPIAAAIFGPICFLIIPIGNIFMGAVKDYVISIASIRNKGGNLPVLAKKYMGNWSTAVLTIFSSLLLILVATIFVTSPAQLINSQFNINYTLVLSLIFIYYIVSTITPIDKIIGRIYPFIGGLLLIGTFLALIGLIVNIFTGTITIPEFSITQLFSYKPDSKTIIPGFFVLVSCGLISGFHSTQTPIVAKTIKNETEARETFYGMMVLEGAIAMIWALLTMIIFEQNYILDNSQPVLIGEIAQITMGAYLSWILILAVVILPITSGDTAFRSLRVLLAEVMNFDQTKMRNRLILCAPLFLTSFLLLTVIDFSLLWSYFTWANHMLAVFALLFSTIYLKYRKQNYYVTLIPAVLLFIIDTLYLLEDSNIGFGIVNRQYSLPISIIISVIITTVVLKYSKGFNNSPDINTPHDSELD